MKESICGSFGESVAFFAKADAQIAEDEVLHAIAGTERCLRAWYGVICMLLVMFGFSGSRFCSNCFWGQATKHAFRNIKQQVENLTQNFACQNPSSFSASSALGKTIHVPFLRDF